MRALMVVAMVVLPSTADAAPASGKTFGVVVVKEGGASAAQIGEARTALRSGLSAAGAKLGFREPAGVRAESSFNPRALLNELLLRLRHGAALLAKSMSASARHQWDSHRRRKSCPVCSHGLRRKLRVAPTKSVAIGRAMRSFQLVLLSGLFLSACGLDRSRVAHSDEALPRTLISGFDRDEAEPPRTETDPCESTAGDTTPGSIDRTFGCESKVNGMLEIYDLVEQADGRILFTGWDSSYDLKVCRILPAGHADESFGSIGGCAMVTANASGVSLALDGEDVYLLAWNGRQILVARLNASGVLDGSFGESGIALLDTDRVSQPKALLLADSKIVVGGEFDEADRDGFLMQLTREGDLDPSFGRNGIVTFHDERDAGGSAVYGLARRNDGIVAATRQAVRAFKADGDYDSTFGGDGTVHLPFYGTALTSTDDLLLVGGRDSVARIRWDGTIETFANQIPRVERIDELRVLPDGSVLIACELYVAFEEIAPGFARLDATGEPDETFGDGATSHYWGRDARALEVLRDGRYLLGGIFSETSGYIIRVWN